MLTKSIIDLLVLDSQTIQAAFHFLFSVHAHLPVAAKGAIFVVAAFDEFDAMHLVREFLGYRSTDAQFGDPDPIGLAAGSGMRPDAIERGIVVSSEI